MVATDVARNECGGQAVTLLKALQGVCGTHEQGRGGAALTQPVAPGRLC